MAEPDTEPVSLIEKWIGRRWSITMMIIVLVIVMVKMGAMDIANTVVGFLALIVGYFFRDITDEKKA